MLSNLLIFLNEEIVLVKDVEKNNKTILIHFRSLQDFKNRIARLWQDQKDDETYEFTFEDDETMVAYIDLVRSFDN